MGKDRALLFCHPGDVYRGMKEGQLSGDYLQIRKELRLLAYGSTRDEPSQNVPDVEDVVATKEGRPLRFRAFLDYRTGGVGNARGELKINNYSFNPINIQAMNRIMPDLEVFALSGENVDAAINNLGTFFAESGWEAAEFNGEVLTTRPQLRPDSRLLVHPNPSGKCPVMHDPAELRKVAEEIGYDSKWLCWVRKP